MKQLLFMTMLALVSCSEDTSFRARPVQENQKAQPLNTEPTPVIATPEVLRGAPLVLPEETVIKIEADQKTGTVSIPIKNIDLDATYSVSTRFEDEKTFSIPSKKTVVDIAPTKTIEVPVKFTPGQSQVVKDNLIITYTDPKSGEERSIHHPVTIIRLPKKETVVTPSTKPSETVVVKPVVQDVKVVVKDVSQKPLQDFGKTMVNEPISSKVIVENVGKDDAHIDIKVSKNENFKIESNDCPQVLRVKESCSLIVSVSADKPGILQDEIVVTYTSPDRTVKKEEKFPLISEKIEDLKTCGDLPCAEPRRQGVLVSSQVFTNEVNFGTVTVGRIATKQVEIQNLGDTALKVTNSVIEGDRDFEYVGGKYPGTKGTCGEIILKGSCVVDLAFKPVVPAVSKGTFRLESDKGDQIVLNLIGKGKEDKKCETINEYLVVPEVTYPASKVIFPYLPKAVGTPNTLTHLYGKEVNSVVKELKTETVKDGQVYVTFKLPAMEGVITDMSFGVNVFKVIRDNFKDTESLCISSNGVRKCSGQRFHLTSWEKLRNPKFWNQFENPVNRRYEDQFSKGEKPCGVYQCMDLTTRYELKDIFELSEAELAKIMKEGIFSLIFSDDTRMLKMPRIEVKTKVTASCE